MVPPRLRNLKTWFLKKEPIMWQKKDIAYFFYLICRPRSQY